VQAFLSSRVGRALAAALIVLAALLAYHNSFSGELVLDDGPSILENPTVRHLWPIWPALAPPPKEGITVSGRPVLNFSLALNWAMGASDVRGYHGVNLIIHILAGLTLFGIVRRTLELASSTGAQRAPGPVGQRPGVESSGHSTALAFAVALLWTVHPLQTESVTYIIQRAESLMGLFYLLTLYCFIRYVDAVEGRAGPLVPPSPTGGPSGPALPYRDVPWQFPPQTVIPNCIPPAGANA